MAFPMSSVPGSWFQLASSRRARLLALTSAFLAGPLAAQVTRAERTQFRETSSYADVLSFLDSLQRAAPDLRVGTLAVSAEGRRVPYVLASRPLVTSPSE